jgi:hypothetical protein
VAKLIGKIGRYLPSTIKQVIIRGDAEFLGGDTIAMCRKCGYDFIFGNNSFAPKFEEKKWYSKGEFDYNDTIHESRKWKQSYRFVVMRMVKEEENEAKQLDLFTDVRYKYRVFATSLLWPSHAVIRKYNKRADAENLIGESQKEGICAIPSKRFLSNHVFFQIVMLTYNIWRLLKIEASYRHGIEQSNENQQEKVQTKVDFHLEDHTIRIARLKVLFVPAKITKHQRVEKVTYSSHDERSAGLCDLLAYLDQRREVGIMWFDNVPLNKYRIVT